MLFMCWRLLAFPYASKPHYSLLSFFRNLPLSSSHHQSQFTNSNTHTHPPLTLFSIYFSMAVQAQYPSNVLLLNRDVQEEKSPFINNYSLQPQPERQVGVFLDQSHRLFNNGVETKQWKRARQVAVTSQINGLVSMQPQSSQLIDVTQLCTAHAQPNVVSTGLQLASGDQQQQTLSPQSSASLFSEDLASLIKQQIVEIDHFIQAQGEQLRRTLADKRQRHYRTLLGAAEESAAKRLREKEAEVEKAVRRNAELEERAAQLSAEAQGWQARAKKQEATAATLQGQLRMAMASGGCAATQQEREEGGRLGPAVGDAKDAESAYVDPDRVVESSGPSCKVCRKRVATVVLLPCRDLCLCTVCDTVVQACPLCLSIRTSSIEVFLC